MVISAPALDLPWGFDPATATGSWGELLSGGFYLLTYIGSWPGTGFVFPEFTAWGLLLIVAALFIRMLRGAPARRWLIAYWVIFSFAVVGVFSTFEYQTDPINALLLALPLILQMIASFALLSARTPVRKAGQSPADMTTVGTVGNFAKTKLLAALAIPVVVASAWIHLGPYTPLQYSHGLTDDFWRWFLHSEYGYFASFVLISGIISIFVATRKTGRARPDLLPVAVAAWFSGLGLVAASVLIKVTRLYELQNGLFDHSYIAPVAGTLSLVIVAVLPGISPFARFRRGDHLTGLKTKGLS
ncbi:MAG: hypothetical protein ACKOWP_03835 [Microbacteriaceae bacterium]